MAQKIEKWESESKQLFDSEIEALKDDVNYWRDKYFQVANVKTLEEARKNRVEERERAFVGPGGGMSNNHP